MKISKLLLLALAACGGTQQRETDTETAVERAGGLLAIARGSHFGSEQLMGYAVYNGRIQGMLTASERTRAEECWALLDRLSIPLGNRFFNVDDELCGTIGDDDDDLTGPHTDLAIIHGENGKTFGALEVHARHKIVFDAFRRDLLWPHPDLAVVSDTASGRRVNLILDRNFDPDQLSRDISAAHRCERGAFATARGLTYDPSTRTCSTKSCAELAARVSAGGHRCSSDPAGIESNDCAGSCELDGKIIWTYVD